MSSWPVDVSNFRDLCLHKIWGVTAEKNDGKMENNTFLSPFAVSKMNSRREKSALSYIVSLAIGNCCKIGQHL